MLCVYCYCCSVANGCYSCPFFMPIIHAQASLSFTVSRSLFKLMFVESVMLSNHLILCFPLLLMCFLPQKKKKKKAKSSETCETFDLTQFPYKTQMPIEEHAFYLQDLMMLKVWSKDCFWSLNYFYLFQVSIKIKRRHLDIFKRNMLPQLKILFYNNVTLQ